MEFLLHGTYESAMADSENDCEAKAVSLVFVRFIPPCAFS